MNNEEKILALLEQLTSDVGTLRVDMSDVRGRLATVETDLSGVKSDVSDVRGRLATVETDLSGVKSDVSGLKSDVSDVRGRLATVETDLSGVKSDVSGMKNDMVEVRLILENKIEPYIERLAEGHQTLLQTLAPVTRVQALEEEFRNRDMAATAVERMRAQKNVQ